MFEFNDDDERYDDEFEGGFALDGFMLVGKARHGQIVPVPALRTKDGIVVRGAAIYNADIEEWVSVIESEIDAFRLNNTNDDIEVTDTSLALTLGQTITTMRLMVRIYNKKCAADDEGGGLIIPA